MHNLYAIFAKYLDICKPLAGIWSTNKGICLNVRGVLRFSDLEVIALNMASESIGIDSYFTA